MSRATVQMGARAGAGRIGYFGKLPARGDFVKDGDAQPVLGMLDDWLAQVMMRLPADARWKLNYDAMAPVSFAFVGQDRRHAVAGHLVGSHDQSGRRFPFLMMRTVDVADPAGFAARCPLAFGPLWRYLEDVAPRLRACDDPGPQLQALAEARVELGEHEAALTEFLAVSTVGMLTAQLALPAHRMILGMGLLLQPVMHSRPAALQKSLVLPLPPESSGMRDAAAAFWLGLVTPFIRRSGFDLALFMTAVRGRPSLVVGFGGEAAGTLHALIDPVAALEHQVHLDDNDWIDEQLGIDIDVRALASYLEQPMLPLRLARELFLKTFIGGEACAANT
jgi:type VI secretion system protein ImpM